MKVFDLNSENLHKGWGGVDQYWFSLGDYCIRDIATLSAMDRPDNMSQSTYLVSIGYIPYFIVTNEEVMRSYVDSITNSKLKKALSNIDDNDYVESFWKYFNVYPELSNGYSDFEEQYVLNKAIKWCENNGVKYNK